MPDGTLGATLRSRGVALFSTPIPWAGPGPVQTYVLRGPPHVVIDPGFVDGWPALAAEMAREGLAPEEVGTILLTHGHQDHCSAAQGLLERTTDPLYLQRSDNGKIHPRYLPRKAAQYRRLQGWFRREGVPDDVFDEFVGRLLAPRFRFTREIQALDLSDGQVLDLPTGPVGVLLTPGHTPGHAVFHDLQRSVVFSGDHLLKKISPNPVLDFDEQDCRHRSLPDYMASLERVSGIDADVWCPGHGELFADPAKVIRGLTRFLRARQDQIQDLVAEEPMASYRIARRLFPQATGLDRFLAFSETVGHLDLMVDSGRLQVGMIAEERIFNR